MDETSNLTSTYKVIVGMEGFTHNISHESYKNVRPEVIAEMMKNESHKRLSEELWKEILPIPIPLPDSAETKDVVAVVLEKLLLPYFF